MGQAWRLLLKFCINTACMGYLYISASEWVSLTCSMLTHTSTCYLYGNFVRTKMSASSRSPAQRSPVPTSCGPLPRQFQAQRHPREWTRPPEVYAEYRDQFQVRSVVRARGIGLKTNKASQYLQSDPHRSSARR